ncbi:MAG: YitT family protein [Flavipsychrobacter sp.]
MNSSQYNTASAKPGNSGLKRSREFFLICAGICSAAIGLKGFLLPNGFLDGGVTGISLLITRLTGFPLPILIVLINIPFIIIAIRQISKEFALKTLLAIAGLALIVAFIEIPHITNDKLLISVFGGFFLGAGIGLAIRGGSVIDGTEVMAIYITRNSSMSVGDVIALFNVLLFCVSALLINIETALYSMLTYRAASKTVDFLITGIEEYIGVTIISEKADEIKSTIINNLGRAVTIYKGEGGFGKKGIIDEDRKIIFSVVTRLEVHRLVHEVEKVDSDAFIIQHTINDTKGGMIKKRPLH